MQISRTMVVDATSSRKSNSMLRIKLQGGLGNQMFQYAFALVYSNLNKEDICFDTSFFLDSGKYIQRPMSISKFNTSKLKTGNFNPDVISKFRNLLLSKIDSDRKIRFIRSNFSKSFLSYCDDYYQSPKYFEKFRHILIPEFSLRKEEETDKYLDLKRKIQNSPKPLIIHARRGDYLKHADTYVILERDYYLRALDELNIKDPDVFIFSDDPEWIESIVGNLNYINISSIGLPDYLEFSLMTFGRYFIIPNSTFSWWAAWISETKNKKVIAPKKWFVKKGWYRADGDIIPPEWTRL